MNSKKRIALIGDCVSPSGLARGTQYETIVSSKDYNTSVETTVKPSAETKTLGLLRQAGFKTIQQLDWVAKNDAGEWVIFEVKNKEIFTPGKNFPYYGIGLNKSQLWLRTQLLNDLGWRTYLINFVPRTDEVYGAYLDELEKGELYDTKNDIRIYPIDNFKALHNAPNQNLGGLM